MNTQFTKPLITEKTMHMASSGWYTFAVDKFARKQGIIQLIAKLYKVTPTDVRTVAMHGKIRRTGRKSILKAQTDWKKAIVQLPKGQTIEAFAITSQEPEKK